MPGAYLNHLHQFSVLCSNGSTRRSFDFESFLHGWLARQEDFLRRLLEAIEPENLNRVELHRALIDEVLSHYNQYFQEQNRAAKDDVFLIFSPPPLLWIGGFKPLLVFKLIESSIYDLTTDQRQRLELAKCETRKDERELSEKMARLQESVASPPLMSMMWHLTQLIDGEVSELDLAVEGLKGGMLAAVEEADRLRGATVSEAVEILCPHQMIKLLAAFMQFHLRVRRWGLQGDENRE